MNFCCGIEAQPQWLIALASICAKTSLNHLIDPSTREGWEISSADRAIYPSFINRRKAYHSLSHPILDNLSIQKSRKEYFH